MNNKKLIRLTESDLHRIVKESVNNVINENNNSQLQWLIKLEGNLYYALSESKDQFEKLMEALKTLVKCGDKLARTELNKISRLYASHMKTMEKLDDTKRKLIRKNNPKPNNGGCWGGGEREFMHDI